MKTTNKDSKVIKALYGICYFIAIYFVSDAMLTWGSSKDNLNQVLECLFSGFLVAGIVVHATVFGMKEI